MKRKFSISLIMLGLLLTAAIGRGVYAQHIPRQLVMVEQSHSSEMPVSEETQITTRPAAEFAQTHLLTDLKEGLQMHFGGGNIVNILLIGKDAQSDSGARSDTMILCTFNKEENTITMTSFLRDLYVKIPGYQKNRINAAYRFGGAPLLKETLNQNFGIRVDGTVEIDFTRFEEVIDSLGGVTLELTAAEADFINDHVAGSELTEGEHQLTGRQALMHARNRYDTDGDFSRTNRQRKLLSRLLEVYRSKNLTQMLSLLQQIRPMVTMDISKSDLTAYAVTLFPMLSDAEIRTRAIPVEGAYSYQTIDGKAVLLPDMKKNIEALEDTLS